MDHAFRQKKVARKRRALRVRKAIRGTALKPRLSVFRSNRHLFAQLIDDEKGITLAAFGTLSKEIRSKKKITRKESAKVVGENIAKLALERKIETIVFDRGRYKFHGLLAELANAARAGGLKF